MTNLTVNETYLDLFLKAHEEDLVNNPRPEDYESIELNLEIPLLYDLCLLAELSRLPLNDYVNKALRERIEIMNSQEVAELSLEEAASLTETSE